MKLKNIIIDNRAAGYLPSDELVYAAEVAYALKRPLLLSGEPGTGKTEFANWLAYQLQSEAFNGEPLVFNTKSTSVAQDLFYYYDAISYFRDSMIRQRESRATLLSQKPANTDSETQTTVQSLSISEQTKRRDIDPSEYISYNALGLAIRRAKGIADKENIKSSAGGSVVLIDEIDKAPRDFPNDLLNEIEKYTFAVKEMDHEEFTLSDDEKKKILVVMTSNFEKNLPEAFLRRCVYFHIKFPEPARLLEIIKKRLNITDENDIKNLELRIADFFKFRTDDNIQKKPSTSECLDYVRVLQYEGNLSQPLFDKTNKIAESSKKYVSLLLKKKEDRDLYITEQ